MLRIYEKTAEAFTKKPFVAFRKNKSLRNIIGQTTIQNNKVVRRNHYGKGQCQPCYSRSRNQCCKQLQDTTSFKSTNTMETFNIYHCQSEIIIYLLECRKCKLQYIGKSETQFFLHLNNHRKDGKSTEKMQSPHQRILFQLANIFIFNNV